MKYRYPVPDTNEITSCLHFQQRRSLIKALPFMCSPIMSYAKKNEACMDALPSDDIVATELRMVKGYNNYYEFSTDKEAIRVLAQALSMSPWNVTFSGKIEKNVTLDMDDIHQFCQVERIYRFRCVEGWSMVVPWIGVPLVDVLKAVKPLSSAKYVQFKGLYRPKEMIGQRRPTLDWPYTEALRMDEAIHPLTILAVGMYGESLPPQNGGPIRLVVPWKYGFKSIKAITEIELLENLPLTTWQKAAPREYGFYANVNPGVSHPRWSQKRESPLGQAKKISTKMFNGYQEQVAYLYKKMDLQKNY